MKMKCLFCSSAQLVSPLQPQESIALPRNPAYKEKGKFLTLAEFLDFAKAKAAPGVLINIQVNIDILQDDGHSLIISYFHEVVR